MINITPHPCKLILLRYTNSKLFTLAKYQHSILFFREPANLCVYSVKLCATLPFRRQVFTSDSYSYRNDIR